MRRLSVMTVWCLPLFLSGLFAGRSVSQTRPVEGLRDNTPKVHALVNARIVQGPGRVIEKGTVVVRDGTIEAVGANVTVPRDARIWDYGGMTVYPGLIELYSHVGLEKKKKENSDSRDKAEAKPQGASYWNVNVTPERNVVESFKPSEKDLESMRALGFTCALIVPDKGAIGGAGVLVNLGGTGLNDQLLNRRVVQCMSLVHRAPGFGRSEYPTALMGRIALIRQALLDAQWYGAAQEAYARNPAQERPETNDALRALYDDMKSGRAVLCAVNDDLNLARAQNIAKEFDLPLWIRGSGHEYRIVGALKHSGTKLIIPVDYPEAPKVETPEQALDVDLYELRHWDAAPSNAAVLERAGIDFAFTSAGLKKKDTFHKQVRRAIERGLSDDAALAALTTVPAKMVGAESTLGTIDRGKSAHLVVTDGDLFAKKTEIVDVWIDGKNYTVNKRPVVDPRGTWDLTLNTEGLEEQSLQLEISGEIEKLKGTIQRDSTEVKLKKITLDLRRLALSFAGDDLDVEGVVRLTGAVKKAQLGGQGELPDGKWFGWQAVPAEAVDDEGDGDDDDANDNSHEGDEPGDGASADKEDAASVPPTYGAFSLSAPPEQPKHILVRNATIWTSGPQGRLEGADLLVTRGKIRKIGRDLKAPSGAVIIDGTGKHVTPGLIDAHSHTGMSGGGNEYGQAVSAEVRVADIVNNRSIGFYRELAGGLTVANILHGSANPIGGQNAVVKLRWGASPEEMLIKDAIPGIKFALGENVKQSNWGDDFTSRYPQTRMGVEQIIRDRFKAALDYEQAWQRYRSGKKKGVIPPRRDLELDTLLEILHGKRLVHCHSYRQDEILMLVRIAEDFGFTIGTFQHVLEGYKVADALAAHGAGASTFSDWWAYKFEVYDAIPYNGALMHDAGVVVSFNSDSGELARRLNLEAAKAVKYGGVSREEALKFVTLNPAKQLRIDHRVGSLEAGKDADFVVWSGDPLSTYSRCEQTWIEGRKYFDIERDHEIREAIRAERARLAQKALTKNGEEKSKEKKREKVR